MTNFSPKQDAFILSVLRTTLGLSVAFLVRFSPPGGGRGNSGHFPQWPEEKIG